MIRRRQPEPLIHQSLGLSELCRRIEGTGDLRILELGPARGLNIDFWSRFSGSIYVADLPSSLPLPCRAEEGEFPELLWDRLVGLPASRRFDVILAWDLLNYLEIATIAELMRYLGHFCRPGTLLFSLIFDLKQMPEKLTTYRIVDEAHISYEYGGPETRACLRHHSRALAAVMGRFQIIHSFRLRNGVIEYLFEYRDDKASVAIG